jgi:hypothetical protein
MPLTTSPTWKAGLRDSTTSPTAPLSIGWPDGDRIDVAALAADATAQVRVNGDPLRPDEEPVGRTLGGGRLFDSEVGFFRHSLGNCGKYDAAHLSTIP